MWMGINSIPSRTKGSPHLNSIMNLLQLGSVGFLEENNGQKINSSYNHAQKRNCISYIFIRIRKWESFVFHKSEVPSFCKNKEHSVLNNIACG